MALDSKTLLSPPSLPLPLSLSHCLLFMKCLFCMALTLDSLASSIRSWYVLEPLNPFLWFFSLAVSVMLFLLDKIAFCCLSLLRSFGVCFIYSPFFSSSPHGRYQKQSMAKKRRAPLSPLCSSCALLTATRCHFGERAKRPEEVPDAASLSSPLSSLFSS